MQFIPETIIDQQYSQIAKDEKRTAAIQSLKAQQPAILAYLFSESFELLTQNEKEYTMFLVLVVWASISEVHPEQKQIDPKMIEKAEDKNWELLKDVKAGNFRDKLDIFFENTSQEDLLAFVEDALVQDEDEMVTKEGREYIFVALKTIIDCLEAAA